MKYLFSELEQKVFIKEKTGSHRSHIIKDIYEIYTSQQQINFRKKENWKRYVEWLKKNKTPDSKEAQKKFEKTKIFIKQHPIKTFCYFMSVIPTNDLFYILSVAKDMQHRQQNFSGYIMAQLLGK